MVIKSYQTVLVGEFDIVNADTVVALVGDTFDGSSLENAYHDTTFSVIFSALPLDEAVASRLVIVIASGSDGRADWRKRFWSQLNNSQTVRDRPYVSIGN